MKGITSTLLELAGATAITAGVHLTMGAGAALIVGGVLAGIFGLALSGPIRRRSR